MKNIYVLEFDMFDGEDNIHGIKLFNNLQDAKDTMADYLEQYEPFWEDFDTINKDDYNFSAYDKERKDLAYIKITIEQRDMR